MKKLLFLFLIISLSFSILNAQENKTKKTEKTKEVVSDEDEPAIVEKYNKMCEIEKLRFELKVYYNKRISRIAVKCKILEYYERKLKVIEDKHLAKIRKQDFEDEHFTKKYKIEKFTKAAKFWRKLRHEQSHYEESLYDGGTAETDARVDAQLRMTKARIKFLTELLENK